MPVGARSGDDRGGTQERIQPLLRVEPTNVECQNLVGRYSDRGEIDRNGVIESVEADAVGDDHQPVGVESPFSDAKPPDPFRHADRASRQPGSEPIQRQMPHPLTLSHPEPTHYPRATSPHRSKLHRDVGVKQEALYKFRLERPKRPA